MMNHNKHVASKLMLISYLIQQVEIKKMDQQVVIVCRYKTRDFGIKCFHKIPLSKDKAMPFIFV